MMPRRVQLQRTKGWRMPENTVMVCRPSKWGNPHKVSIHGREGAIRAYQTGLEYMIATGALDPSELAGKNLACWCALDMPCHADILLDVANASEPQ